LLRLFRHTCRQVGYLADVFAQVVKFESAGSGANSISRDLEFGRAFLIRRQDRIMFGTDFLAPGQHVPQFELFEQQLDLPADVREKVYRRNARKLLKL
jgi:hypothetical protein